MNRTRRRSRAVVLVAIAWVACVVIGIVVFGSEISGRLRVDAARAATRDGSLIGTPVTAIERRFGPARPGEFNGWSHAILVGPSPGIVSVDNMWLLLDVDESGLVIRVDTHIE